MIQIEIRRPSVRRAIIGLAILLTTAASAQAITLKDIVDLTKAGLGDEVLLALIEVDGRVFSIDPQTLTQLKAAGVSEKVIVALVRSGRERPPTPEPVQPTLMEPEPVAPQVVYVQQPAPVVHEVAVPVPFYVPVPVAVRGHHDRGHAAADINVVQPSITAPPDLHGPTRYETDVKPPAKPEYWGNGGKLRPDAWKQ